MQTMRRDQTRSQLVLFEEALDRQEKTMSSTTTCQQVMISTTLLRSLPKTKLYLGPPALCRLGILLLPTYQPLHLSTSMNRMNYNTLGIMNPRRLDHQGSHPVGTTVTIFPTVHVSVVHFNSKIRRSLGPVIRPDHTVWTSCPTQDHPTTAQAQSSILRMKAHANVSL